MILIIQVGLGVDLLPLLLDIVVHLIILLHLMITAGGVVLIDSVGTILTFIQDIHLLMRRGQ